jgi:hypothetical protein
MAPFKGRIRCRAIEDADIEAVTDLLASGFRERQRGFWVRALDRLARHPTPNGFAPYGYMLADGRHAVGVMLAIATQLEDGKVRCNNSSWYVDPAYRGYSLLLRARAIRRRDVTYLNISPNLNLLPLWAENFGYQRYSNGRFFAMPALSLCREPTLVVPFDQFTARGLSPFDAELLARHARYGCLSLVCHSEEGWHPFVFAVRCKFTVAAYAYLVYCRSVDEFVRFAGILGRYLMRHRLPLVVLDANGPVDGLVGQYRPGAPKFFKGPDRPRLGDLAYTERVMFGV